MVLVLSVSCQGALSVDGAGKACSCVAARLKGIPFQSARVASRPKCMVKEAVYLVTEHSLDTCKKRAQEKTIGSRKAVKAAGGGNVA